MRHFIAGLGVILALTLLAVSAAMNFRFGESLGRNELDALIYGVASASADGFKALTPFFGFWALRHRQWLAAGSALAIYGVCTTFSVTSALGFAALNRAEVRTERVETGDAYGRVKRSIERVEAKLKAVPGHRPAAVLEKELERERQYGRWAATKGCLPEETTASASKRFCDDYRALESELASAGEARRLEGQLAGLKEELAGLAPVSSASGDPQVDILRELSGWDRGAVETALIVLVGILVEVGSGLGLYVATTPWRAPDGVKTVTDLRPGRIGYVQGFAMACIYPQLGARITADDLFDAYWDWCEREGLIAMKPALFLMDMREFANEYDIELSEDGGNVVALNIVVESRMAA